MNNKISKKAITIIVIIAVAVFLLANALTIVEAGHTGVVTTFGKVNDRVLTEGLHLKIPFAQNVIKIDNRIVKLEVETEAFSKDLQTVKTVLAINYRVDSAKSFSIYKNVGAQYESVLIVPAVNEVLKATTAQYTAEESVTNRALISEGLVGGLNDKLNDSGLYVTDVNIINFDFSDAFITAIEEKQVAQQQLLKAETEKKTAMTNAEAEAEAMKIRAQGEAEATKLKAEGEAAANDTINSSLNANIIEYYKITKWNGELPKVTGNSEVLVNMDSLTGAAQ